MIIREKTYIYSSDDLIDKVNSSLLSDEAKQTLIKFIDDIAVYHCEIYHQLTRQALTANIYKMYDDVNKGFAQLVFDCLSSESIQPFVIEQKVNGQLGKLRQLLYAVSPVITQKVEENIENSIKSIETICDTFKNSCNGIAANNQDIYGNTDITDFTTVKSYKFMFDSDSDEEDKDTEPTNTSLLNNNDSDNNLKLISLKQLGLKIRPVK
jgi:hypothetical protein